MAILLNFPSKLRRRSDRPGRVGTGDLIDALDRLSGTDQILSFLDAVLKETFRVSSVAVSLLEPITGRFLERKLSRTAESEQPSLDFAASGQLAGWLALNQTPAILFGEQDLRSHLSPVERDHLSARGIRVIVPMCSANHLVGLLHIGPRNDVSEYAPPELQEIAALAHQAASSLGHALARDASAGALTKLFRADKLATVGELAAGAAHEIRNPLTLIRAAVQLITNEVSPGRRPLLETALSEVDRIDSILKGLLSLSRTSRLEMTCFSIEELISQSMLLLHLELKKRRINTTLDVSVSDAMLTGDRSQMQQALLNVFWNAVQAMPRGGALHVSVADGRPIAGQDDGTPSLVIRISDTGEGIPLEIRDRIFDPFFTTKEDGTGLGLSISYGIVVRHGGEVFVESSTDQVDHGTRVTVMLPRIGTTAGTPP